LKDYAAANRPLIILDVVSSWRCWTDWRNEDGTAKLQDLGEEFAGFEGPLTNCTTGEQDTWDIGTFFNCLAAGQGCESLYLKDWHFVHTYQSKGQEAPYDPPSFLSSPMHDWLNHYKGITAPGKEDYRFCYVGSQGTCTELHVDVLFSYSWSANIVGRKRWLFYPPEVAEHFKGTRPGVLPKSAQPGGYDVKEFPRAAEAYEQRMEVIQEAGELIFVPSGWHHEVENLTLAISINHNWLNASNVERVWTFLQERFLTVQGKIGEDYDGENENEFLDLCNKVMKADCDMNIPDFLELLTAAWGVLRCLIDEEHTGEALYEQEWVEERLRKISQECVIFARKNATTATRYAANRLEESILESFQAIVDRAVQGMTTLSDSCQLARDEHLKVMAQLDTYEQGLMQKFHQIQERRKQVEERCQRNFAELSM